jgi:signal transduction histidine kinase
MARQIVNPIRVIAKVAEDVRFGNINARFIAKGRQNDEVVRLGLDFNRMLDTLDKNNKQLVAYQNELENKVRELASREVELQNHRQHLEELIEERTVDLKKINIELQQEIDERETAEEALRLAHRDLAQKASDLEEANKELSQYAYAISHDITTPLRAIHNYADFLKEDLEASLDGDQKMYLDGLVEAVGQGEELVEDLLELSRISGTSGQIKTIDVGRFLHELIDFLDLSVDVEVVLAEDWPSIDATPTLLRQIFQNSLELNHVTMSKYSMCSSGFIRVRSTRAPASVLPSSKKR